MELLGRLRFEEGLREAERDRLVRQVEVDNTEAAAAGQMPDAAPSRRRILGNANGAGEVPGL